MTKEPQLYELGYLLFPTVSAEKVADEVVALRSAIESAGGMIIEEEQPKMRVLAYPVSRVLSNKKIAFDQAHFGWIKYQVGSDSANAIKEAIYKRDNVLRFLIVKYEKEERAALRRPVVQRVVVRPEALKDKAVMSDQDIDREIESLIAEHGDAAPAEVPSTSL